MLKNKLVLYFLIFDALIIGAILAIGFLHPARFATFDLTNPTSSLSDTVAKSLFFRAPVSKFNLKVKDTGAGLKSVNVVLQQGEVIHEVLKRESYGDKEIDELLEIRAGQPKLVTGKAIIKVIAKDNSLFGNTTESQYEGEIDYTPPQVEILTLQHNGGIGGALLAIYQLPDGESGTISGSKVNGVSFPGYPLSEFLPSGDLLSKEELNKLRALPNAYFTLFPISILLKEEPRLEIFAQDLAGNESVVALYNTLKPKSLKKAQMPLPRKFFESSARKLLSKYYLSANLPVHEFNPQKSDAELASDFQLINEKYRSLLQDEITALSAKSEEKRYFEGTFIRPLAAAPTSTFGEHRFYFITSGGSQVPAGESYHMGIDLAHVVNAEVGASNNGKVLFAGDLGIYGNTVILDHGFQLISLYGHLSSIACKVGDIKMKGEKLGTTGATGLAGGDHLHFEIRLYGIPVSPFEWLDSHWIQDRLNLPLKEVLQGR